MSARAAAVACGAALSLAACTPAQNGGGDGDIPPASVASADARLTMQRLPCFGTCPVYTVELAGDGRVTFTGENFVDSTGVSTRRIDADAAAALIGELVDAGFLEFDDEYTMDSKGCGPYHTDAPGVVLTLRLDGSTKTVRHDHGCSGAPAALRRLQDRVDSVTGAGRWIGSR